jgi:GT2 family glycosyltransferase
MSNSEDYRDPSISVIVITFQRPTYVERNLQHLQAQIESIDQVLVVDASTDSATQEVCERFPFATYVRNPRGAGNMADSRNVGLCFAACDVIAFLDDDAFVEPNYTRALRAFCRRHPDAGLGCARTLNGSAIDAAPAVRILGRRTPSLEFYGNFDADPGRDVRIDHGIGATMWFRRRVIDSLGRFREFYTGTCIREDADSFVRAAALGHEAWFVRDAVALHVAAPHAIGRRFDLRYSYWFGRNDAILAIANFGFFSQTCLHAMIRVVPTNLRYGGAWYRRLGRTAVICAGWIRGVGWAISRMGLGPLSPGEYRIRRVRQ